MYIKHNNFLTKASLERPPYSFTMPSWILPGRSNARITRYKAILEKSFAFSQTCNPRNLEYHWYPTWNQVLSDLVIDVPNLIVAPQYPIWFVPQNDEENGDASDPEETEDDEDISDPEQIQDDGDNGGADDPEEMVVSDDEDHVMADVSFASTLPEKGAKSAIVDFAIIHLTAVPQPKHTTRYNGWRITQANVGLLVEVKKFASRSLTGAELEHAVQGRIAGARDDLINQAAHLFVQDECKDSVMAIAAAGNSHPKLAIITETHYGRHPYS